MYYSRPYDFRFAGADRGACEPVGRESEMNGVCGIQRLSSAARRRRRRHGVSCCVALLAVTLGLLAPAGVAHGGNAPQPQQLWKAYPLDPTYSDSARAPSAKPRPAPSPEKRAPASHRRLRTTASGNGSFPTLWIALAAALVAALAGTLLLVRRMTVPSGRLVMPSLPRARPQRIVLVSAAAAHGLSDGLMENVRRFGHLRPLVETESVREPARLIEDRRSPEPPPAKRVTRSSNAVLTPDRLVALEQKTLKRKRASGHASEAAAMKAKTWEPARGKEAKSGDVKELREKLARARTPEWETDALPVDPPKRPLKELRAARSVRHPVPVQAQCRIGWWRGYIKSEFYAKARMPDGRELVVRTSPGFRWSKATPPPKEARQVAEVHRKLVDELVGDGWVVSGGGEGDEWWALELNLRENETIDSQKGATWPPTRTSSA